MHPAFSMPFAFAWHYPGACSLSRSPPYHSQGIVQRPVSAVVRFLRTIISDERLGVNWHGTLYRDLIRYTRTADRLAVSAVELHVGRARLGNVVPGTTRNDVLLPIIIAENGLNGGKHDLEWAELTFAIFYAIHVHTCVFTNCTI